MNTNRIANILIMPFLFLCLATASFGIIVLRDLRAFGWTGSVFFFGFPLVVGAILVALLRLERPWKINFVLSLVSLMTALYIAELIFTLTSPAASSPQIDARSQVDLVMEMREAGERATINIRPRFFVGDTKLGSQRLLPLGGVANSTIVLCNEIGKWVFYESDEHGFRNPRGIYDAEQVQVAGLGDSFAQGYCAESDETILGRIRLEFPNTLNFGMGGSGPLLELATLREYVAPLEPETVLWFYYEGNDLYNMDRESRDSVLMRYLTDSGFSQGLLERRDEIQPLMEDFAEAGIERTQAEGTTTTLGDYAWYLRKHPVFQFLTFHQLLGRLHLFPTPEETMDTGDVHLLGRIFESAKHTVDSWGGDLHVVYLCQKKRFGRWYKPSPHRDQVLRILDDLGVQVVDGCEIFGAEGNPLSLYQGHFTPRGNELIAEAILGQLDDDR